MEVEKNLLAKGACPSKVKGIVFKQKQIDIKAFTEADRVVFPCIGAVACYSEFLDEIGFDYSKIDTILTGTAKPVVGIDSINFRRKNNIPSDRKLVACLGRKTYIKGFDVFLEVAYLLRGHSDIIFVCAGVGEIQIPCANNILDLGWTDDPGSLLNACDLVIAPNRATYFDIGILQAISLGKVVLSSLTGGNSFFKGKDIDVYLTNQNSPSEYAAYILNLALKSSDRNSRFYQNYLTNTIFADRYVKYYSSLASLMG